MSQTLKTLTNFFEIDHKSTEMILHIMPKQLGGTINENVVE